MPGSVTSVFGEPSDFETALRAAGVQRLLVTQPGSFRARLIEIALHRLRLLAAEEQLARLTFVAVPAETVLVLLALGDGPWPICGGIELRAGEIVAIGGGERLHARTSSPARWSAIEAPLDSVMQAGRVLRGAGFAVQPGLARWRPAGRDLHNLHRAAIRTAETRAPALADAAAAHGLEQQLLHALIECLASAPVQRETPSARRHRNLIAQFEALVEAEPWLRLGEIAAALGMSQRMLRACCRAHLGMGPSAYRRLRAMQEVHLALRSGADRGATVYEVAARYGFREPGRFAGRYRALYGEAPSATFRRRALAGSPAAAPVRPRVKLS